MQALTSNKLKFCRCKMYVYYTMYAPVEVLEIKKKTLKGTSDKFVAFSSMTAVVNLDSPKLQ